MKKKKIHLEWDSNYIFDTNITTKYTNFIIVSTNIAESSITISSLYYVFDLGFIKNKKSINDLKTIIEYVISPITNTSMVQRKGRVGRVKKGEVYYFYMKKTRKNIKEVYKISTENIFDVLAEILRNNIITSYFDNSNYPNLFISCNENFIINNDLIEEFFNFKKKFYINDLKYNNNKELDFFINNESQTYENILDYNGKFYLIHIEEMKIKRNILNEIIYKDINLSNSIKTYLSKNYMIKILDDQIYHKNDIVYYSNILSNIFEIENKYILILIFGIFLNLDNYILKFIFLITEIYDLKMEKILYEKSNKYNTDIEVIVDFIMKLSNMSSIKVLNYDIKNINTYVNQKNIEQYDIDSFCIKNNFNIKTTTLFINKVFLKYNNLKIKDKNIKEIINKIKNSDYIKELYKEKEYTCDFHNALYKALPLNKLEVKNGLFIFENECSTKKIMNNDNYSNIDITKVSYVKYLYISKIGNTFNFSILY